MCFSIVISTKLRNLDHGFYGKFEVLQKAYGLALLTSHTLKEFIYQGTPYTSKVGSKEVGLVHIIWAFYARFNSNSANSTPTPPVQ